MGTGKNKSLSVEVSYKSVAVRAFYFGLDLNLNFDLSQTLDINIDLSQMLYLDIGQTLSLKSSRILDFDIDLNLSQILNFDLNLCQFLKLDANFDPELRDALQQLKEQILAIEKNDKAYINWSLINGKTWSEQLRNIMINYRNIGHDWQFSEEQKELLQQYYDANKLLADCLNSDCYVSRDVRQYIEDTLLLPIAEIKPYR